MDIRQLEYFITIVEEGTISAAAKKLHLTQPPLSLQIKHLEEELHTTLFIRNPRKVECTESGELLYKRAKSILEFVDQTQKEVSNQNNGKSGTLHLGIISSVHEWFIHEWILPFSKKYPSIHFHIVEANTYQLIESLEKNELDLAIVRTPFHVDHMNQRVLMHDSFVAIGHSHFFPNNQEEISLMDLKEKPLIIYQRWKETLDTYFHAYQIEPTYYCLNEDARTTLTWANAGLGVGIAPASSIQNLHISCEQKKISDELFHSDICILQNPLAFMSTTSRLFLECFE